MKLKDKIKVVLDEGRMLILGAQVLLGFQYRSVFETGFDKLPHSSQLLKLAALCLMLLAIMLLMSPGAFHRIVAEGEDREDVHNFATSVMDVALLPFALGLGIDVYVATQKLAGTTYGIIGGLVALLFALFFWYGLEMLRKSAHRHREGRAMKDGKEKSEDGGTKLKDKIEQVLTEARMVLPGAQALLGFQFATMLVEGFEKLPVSSRYVHLISLFFIALSIIFLMTPAAYHRLVERGEATQHFHRFASRMLLAAMIPLALGIAGDLFVVMRKVTESMKLGVTGAVITLVIFYGFWFGYTFYRRSQQGAALRKAGKRSSQFAS
ncbi:MAG: DUF6328 family protein [Pyrinomonadaceae bacterium]